MSRSRQPLSPTPVFTRRGHCDATLRDANNDVTLFQTETEEESGRGERERTQRTRRKRAIDRWPSSEKRIDRANGAIAAAN